jgi:hypothetical protein
MDNSTFPTDVGVFVVIKPKDLSTSGQPKVKLMVVYRNDEGELRVTEQIGTIGLSSLAQMKSSTEAGNYIWFGPMVMPAIPASRLDENFRY